MPPPPDKKKKKNKKPVAAPAPTENFKMPAPPAAPAAGPNNQLDQALTAPMPDISALLTQSGKQDMEKTNSLLNAGLIRGLKTDNYGDVQTGSRNPWKNGTFGTPEQVAQRANAGYEQRQKELARPAGQYNIPKPQATLPAPDFVPRGGAMGVQNLERNWNEGNVGMLGQPKSPDMWMEEINRMHPGLANIRNMTEVASTTPTVPSPTALIDAEYAVNRVPTPNELAMVNNDPQVLKAVAQQKAGQEMLAQNEKESAYWTGVQSDLNNKYKNLYELTALEEKPMGFLDTYTSFESPERKREMELNQQLYGQVDASQIPNPMRPNPKGLIPQMGANALDESGDIINYLTQKAAPVANYLLGTELQGTNYPGKNTRLPSPSNPNPAPPFEISGEIPMPSSPQMPLYPHVPQFSPTPPQNQAPWGPPTPEVLNMIQRSTGFQPLIDMYKIPKPMQSQSPINPFFGGM
jgi:hypothetical protein